MANGDANRLAHTNEEIMQDYWIDFESLPWESVMDGVRQKVIAHSGKKVRLVEPFKGAHSPLLAAGLATVYKNESHSLR
jgi:hypothetical protein